MYDIRQFRPTLYLLIGLGFSGFALATGAPLLWVIALALLVLNGWLVRNDRFRPLPRWGANGLTLLAAVYTATQIWSGPQPIFPIGNFLVVLQLIKLYEHRANRDFAQLLVLSLLLMVAAAISTASLTFGIVFIGYLLLSPYTCLLFHLKVETDHAKRQMGLDERLANPMTLRQDQRFLRRSMTRLTGFIAVGAVVMGVIVFLFFPRIPGANLLTWQFRPSSASSGMSEQMDMQSVTRVQQNTLQIASVTVTHNGAAVTAGPLYLRGTVFDVYDGDAQSGRRWSWQRAGAAVAPQPAKYKAGSDELLTSGLDGGADVWVQDFSPLRPTGTKFLLAMPGAARISVDRDVRLAFVAPDSLLQLEAELFQPLEYRVSSTGAAPYVPTAPQGNAAARTREELLRAIRGGTATRMQSTIAPEIAAYARRPDVSGVDGAGRPLVDGMDAPLPAARPAAGARAGRRAAEPGSAEGARLDVSGNNAAVARNIERHLQTKFTYTLDISANPPPENVDPIVHFLLQSKTGWCERYASAMTLMCQSLGMQARLVSGYKCDEFNAIGGYFIVRQSHAHAWVEVLVRDGERFVWRTFDPTSGIDAGGAAVAGGAWQRISHLFDYLEHTWANSVVAYDAGAQTGMLDTVEVKLVNAAGRASSAVHDSGGHFGRFSDWLSGAKYTISEGAIVILVALMSLVAVGLIAGYVLQRMRLTRRARRIGLGALRGAEARRLARQLGFYDELTQILERRAIVRPPHLTPLEFGRSLDFLPREAYRGVVGLTQIFYRIRYGNARLTAGQRRALGRVIARLHEQLFPPTRRT